MPIKLIIFDLDGTLVNSIADITNSLNYAVKPYNIAPKTKEEVGRLVGVGITNLIEKVLGEENIRHRDDVVNRWLEFYSNHIVDNTFVYPGVRETLKRLDGYRKGVISNKREALSVSVLKGLDLFRYFDAVLGSDSVNEKKPSPAPVLHLLSLLGVSADEAIMVGDSELDIAAGKGAGVRTVGVTYGYRDRSYLSSADVIIDSIDELPAIIESTKGDQ